MGTKISALPSASALVGTETFVCVQGGTTKKTTGTAINTLVQPVADAQFSLWIGVTANSTELGAQVTGTVHDATNASPIVVNSVGHTLFTGSRVTIAGATGNTAANGTFTVTRVDADNFSLNGSTGNGAYNADSGTWTQLDLGNIAIGPALGSLANNTSGFGNIAIGPPSLDANANPLAPLASNTTGKSNVAIGGSVLQSNTTGIYNVAIGEFCMPVSTTAPDNVAVGTYCLMACTTGDNNIAIGNVPLLIMTTGSHNTAIGDNAGNCVVTGSDNIHIGRAAGGGSFDATNTICIGKTINPLGSNQAILGGLGANSVVLGFAGTNAPADGEIASSQAFLYWDFTNGAPALKVKGKTADGTVFSKTLTWS